MVLQCFTHFERMLGNNVDCLGEPPVNVSIMIPHFEKMPSNKADSWECPHVMLLLCSTSFERDAG